MRIHKNPLKNRLQALSYGYQAAYQSFSGLPVTVYLGGYPAEWKELAALIRYPYWNMGELSCRDVAGRIRQMRALGIPAADAAAAILEKPLRDL